MIDHIEISDREWINEAPMTKAQLTKSISEDLAELSKFAAAMADNNMEIKSDWFDSPATAETLKGRLEALQGRLEKYIAQL